MYSCDFLLVGDVYLFWYFLCFFSVLFASGLKLFCAKGFCSSKTIFWATKWTCLFWRSVTLTVFSSFHSNGEGGGGLDEIRELTADFNVEAFSSLSRATTAVHCGCGMTYLPYHKLPYSLMIGADLFKSLNKSHRLSYWCTNSNKRF